MKKKFLVVLLFISSISQAGKRKEEDANRIINDLIAKCEEAYYKDPLNDFENVPFLAAVAQEGRYSIASSFVETNRDLNERCSCGSTPLMLAIIKKREQIAKLLIENDADISLKNKWNQTALSLAKEYKQDKILELLYRKLLVQFVECDNIKKVKLLVKKGVSPNAKNFDGTPILSIACDKGYFKIAEYLVDKGASVSEVDSLGNPPLIFAAYSGNLDIVKLLIEHGADVDVKSKFGQSALVGIDKDNTMQKVVLPGKKNRSNYSTALQVAVIKGHKDIVKLLLENGADTQATYSWGAKVATFSNDSDIEKLIQSIDEVDNDFSGFCSQSEEIKNILAKRWISQNKEDYIEKLNKWVSKLPRHDKSKNIYRDLLINSVLNEASKGANKVKYTFAEIKRSQSNNVLF